MSERNLGPAEPTVSYRVQWWTKHEDGNLHANFHNHNDHEAAKADLKSCEAIAHIVSASLTEVVVSQRVLTIFSRAGREVGAPGAFTEQAA